MMKKQDSRLTHRQMIRNYAALPEKPLYTSAMVAAATLISEHTVRHYLADLVEEGVIARLPQRVSKQYCYRTLPAVAAERQRYDWRPRLDVLRRIWQVMPGNGWYTAQQVIALTGLKERSMYRYLDTAVYLGTLLTLKAGLHSLRQVQMYHRGIEPQEQEMPLYSEIRRACRDMKRKEETDETPF